MKRKALFVGINDYEDAEIAKLRFAISDATKLYGRFCALGFTAEILNEPALTSKNAIIKTYQDFTSDLGPGDVFLFYFAGHGYTATGSSRQLLVARDDIFCTLEYQEGGGGVSYDLLSGLIEKRGCHSIFVLDACRSEIQANNTRGAACPPRDLVPKERLVIEQKHGGTMVALRSCGRRQRAHEVPRLRHGLYTYAILEVLREHYDEGKPITFNSSLSGAVARKMNAIATEEVLSGQQNPEIMEPSGLDLPCVWSASFAGESKPVTTVTPDSKPVQVRKVQPLYRVIDLTTGKEETLSAVPSGGWTDEYKTTKLVLRRIEPGTFTMGSPENEEGRYDDEKQHRVTLTKPYYLGVFEVTQKQWELVAGGNRSEYKSPTRPVENVSYEEIRGQFRGGNWPGSARVDEGSFLGKLRAKTGLTGLDLPTEAQWEYACRAGTTTALPNGQSLHILGDYNGPVLDDIAWYGGNSGVDYELANGWDSSSWSQKQYNHQKAGTHPVGKLRANEWGLYDMIGNVWEWCLDWFGSYGGDATDPKGPASGENRVVRGGSWFCSARYCRSAPRVRGTPGYRYDDLGFRLWCSAGPYE